MVGCRASGVQGVFSRSLALLLGLSFVLAFLVPLAPTAEAAAVVTGGELPSPRVGSAAVGVGNGIFYTFGGRSGQVYLDEVVKFDAKTGKSTIVDHLPTSLASGTSGRQSAAAVYAKDLNKIYVFGGASLHNAGDLNGDGTEDYIPKSIPDIVEFNVATEESQNMPVHVRAGVPDNALPKGLWGMGAVWTGEVAYLFGGFTFDITDVTNIARRDWILKFDPDAGATEAMTELVASLPYPVQDAATARFGDQAFLFGGLADNNTANPCPLVENDSGQMVHQATCATQKIVVFDFEAQVASVIGAEMPVRTQFAGGATAGDKIFVFGGRATDAGSYSSIWQFDPKTKKGATLFPTLPSGRYGAPAAAEGSDVFLFGGRDSGTFSNGMKDVLKFKSGATEPWAPRLLAASPIAGGGIKLQWREPSYDGGATISAYNVYRIAANATVQLVGSTPGTLEFTDRSARPGEAYVYRVTSVNSFGESPTGIEVDSRAETKPPGAPTGFQAFPGDAKVVLRWRAPTETGGSAVGEYRIYRTPGPADGKPLDFARPDQLEYVDTDVQNDATYEYTVAAVNGKGEGAHTPVKAVTPIPVPGTPRIAAIDALGETLRIAWTLDEGFATGFHVYRGTEPDHLARLTAEPVAGSPFVDESVDRGQLYYYAIAGVNARGEGAWSALATGGLIDPPAAPKNLLAKPAPGAIELTWLPLAADEMGGSDAVTYLVERTGPDGTPRIIASELKVTKYSDRDVIPGVPFKYVVKAFNGRTGAPSTMKTASALEIVNEPPTAVLQVIDDVDPKDNRFALEEEVRFDASQSTDDSGRIVEYVWTWGDGTPDTRTSEPTATHKFYREEGFTVKLAVVDALGARSTNDASATVYMGSAGTGNPDDNPTGYVPPSQVATIDESERPGSKSLPAPGLALAMGALAAVALAARRRDR